MLEDKQKIRNLFQNSSVGIIFTSQHPYNETVLLELSLVEKRQSQNEIAYKQQYEAPVFFKITSCCCCCDPNLPEHLSVFHQLISVHAPGLSTDILPAC